MNHQDVKQVVSSDLYDEILTKIREIVPIKMCEDDQEYEYLDLNFALEKINKANLTIQEIEDFMTTQKENLISYSVNKMNNYVDLGEEYPEGEEPDPDDDYEDEEINLGYSKFFVLTDALEYIMAQKGKTELVKYLKRVGISHAAKYAKQIITDFVPDSD
ncbi:hypothetical protein [Xylocopilactobacillus apicola]|uniref:Uncharacterized protein n=1 Tax=Xylocopilactobacillus apicola TaxID=2932184 RepID=A0AAU9D5T5_9LACO|nr:hypothetical protein [Xylocopilactobacillus apicola]BDR57635.1 hypothetical protein XA3_00760 [Xylocopilactobacillus apicola]